MSIKKLILFLLIPFAVFAQTDVKKISGERYSGIGKPGFQKYIANAALYLDNQSDSTWQFQKQSDVKGRWVPCTDSVAIRDLKGAKGDKGDPGPMGPQGPAGGGSMTFPFIVVVGTGNDDIALNAAIQENRISRKPIYFVGTLSTGEISIPKDSYNLTLIMWGATVNVKSTATAWLKRVLPVNNKEALDYFSPAQFIIKGGRINGYSNQVCFDLGASYMATYEETKIIGFKTAIHLRFALRTHINQVMAENCLNGFLVDIGNWPDASYTSSNSQSNQTTISNSRVDYQIAGGSGDVGIGVYGCSGVVIENTIVEGAKYKKTIDKDFKMCPNDKDFTVRNLHLEGIYGNAGAGTGEAYIYIRLTGVAVIDGIYSQYAGCFVDAGTPQGEVDVHILHCSWLVAKNGKLFNNAGGVRWIFDTNSYQSLIYRASEIAPAFTGIAVTQCNDIPCSPNTFRIQ